MRSHCMVLGEESKLECVIFSLLVGSFDWPDG